MSRIGKRPIIVPEGVKVAIAAKKVTIESSKGKLEHAIPKTVSVEYKDNLLIVKSSIKTKDERMQFGTTRAILATMIKGVTEGYSKQLEVVGVGFRAQVQGPTLTMQLGFTHPVVYTPPEGVKIETPKPISIIVRGIDKTKVGQAAAEIRGFMPPEPYKGKGIRYAGERVRKKLGKAISKQAGQ